LISVHWLRVESAAYWTLFAAAFLTTACWQTFRPARRLSVAVARRWGNHALLMTVSTAASMLLYRSSSVMAAAAVESSRFGLLNRPWMPFAARCILAVLLLDLTRYGLHLLHHSVALLWRLHQVHHSDPDCDLSTGFRAHPIETLLWQGGYLAVIAVFAPPAAGVLAVELGSLFQSFFSHANATLPPWMEKPLRYVFVTPQMHAIHHSAEVPEQGTNLSDIFPWWDHVFGTYLHAPAAGQERLVTGMKEFQSDRSLDVSFMLLQPFRDERGGALFTPPPA
jgi:sterol desaturase/sphingolipid hydroxylase (fatty acid hydroxylase superfamily)